MEPEMLPSQIQQQDPSHSQISKQNESQLQQSENPSLPIQNHPIINPMISEVQKNIEPIVPLIPMEQKVPIESTVPIVNETQTNKPEIEEAQKEGKPNEAMKMKILNVPNTFIYHPQTHSFKEFKPGYQAELIREIDDLFIDMSFLNKIPPIELIPEAPGSVVKYLLQQGIDESFQDPIQKDATAKIIYEGRKENGELLDTKRDRRQIRNIKVLSDNYIKGVHIALLSMKKKEIS